MGAGLGTVARILCSRLVRRESRIRNVGFSRFAPFSIACPPPGLKRQPLSLSTRKAKERVTEPFAQEINEWARNCMWET